MSHVAMHVLMCPPLRGDISDVLYTPRHSGAYAHPPLVILPVLLVAILILRRSLPLHHGANYLTGHVGSRDGTPIVAEMRLMRSKFLI